MSATVPDVLLRYGILVERQDAVLFPRLSASDKQGPSGTVGLRWPSTVFAGRGADPAHVLHEGAHLICARVIDDVDSVPEEDGLLQLERALARFLTSKDRRAVLAYQRITALDMDRPDVIGRPAEVGDWRRPTRTRWWRNGLARAVELGVLDANGKPTWRRAWQP